ncbi:MAG: VacJ family lipoprotein [Alphaproteobacteria bacterium]|nr:MAG: VacJ family lipoprotein [Alphaproteobacteria bacterium]
MTCKKNIYFLIFSLTLSVALSPSVCGKNSDIPDLQGFQAPVVQSQDIDDEDDENDEMDDEIDDPFEFVNRLTFGVNQSLDAIVLKPAAHVYQGLIPQGARNAVSNFIENVGEPVSVLNHFFQQNSAGIGASVKRLFINTFMGFFGFFDVASEIGIKSKKQRFMDTLSKADLGPGPYFVLPILGPSNLRDSFGLAVDWLTDPFGWMVADRGTDHTTAWMGTRILDARTKLMNLIDAMNKSPDPYARYRFMYNEFRRSANADTSTYEAPVPQGAVTLVFDDEPDTKLRNKSTTVSDETKPEEPETEEPEAAVAPISS